MHNIVITQKIIKKGCFIIKKKKKKKREKSCRVCTKLLKTSF